jgi:hypothetical protein
MLWTNGGTREHRKEDETARWITGDSDASHGDIFDLEFGVLLNGAGGTVRLGLQVFNPPLHSLELSYAVGHA